MLLIIVMACVSVAACLVTLSRVIGWRAILRYATWIDVGFTLGLAAFLAGTMTGALVAVLGGLIMALVLTIAKKVVGYAEKALEAKKAPSAYAHEYNEKGWIYNQAPYI